MSKQSASGASIIGGILVVGLLVRLLAAVWLYLLIGGAVTLVLWAGWEVLRRKRLSPAPPPLAPREPVQASSAPSSSFRVLNPIDPKVFDDPEKAKTAALTTFDAWMRQLPMSPQNPASLVQSVDLKVQYVGRLDTTLAERKVEWRQSAHAKMSQVGQPKIAPAEVDPWAITSKDLRSSSLYITACDACAGDGKRPCPKCGGTMSVKCPECVGEGKSYGYASNGSRRLMNCKPCRAKGTLTCTQCTNGELECRSCGGTGRAERWLEFKETSRSDMRVVLDKDNLSAFPWASKGAQADLAELESDAKPVGRITSQGPLTLERASEIVPRDWLEANWQQLQPKLSPGERIHEQSLQIFEVPTIQLSYTLANAHPTEIRFEGRRLLAPPNSVDWQIQSRAQRIRRVHQILLSLCIGVPLAYLLRGFYFWSGWVVGTSVCLAIAALGAERFVREWTLGQSRARRWAALSMIAMAFTCGLAIAAEPRIGTAERHLSEGRLEEARAELTALGNPDRKSHAQAWSALRLAHALQNNDITVVARDASNLPDTAPERAVAEQHLYELTQRLVHQYLSRKSLSEARAALLETKSVLYGNGGERPFAQQFAALKAGLHEAEHAACTTDVCRWRTAFDAAQSASSKEREHRLAAARAVMVETLTPQPRARASAAAWLRRLDTAAALAQAINEHPGDEDLSIKARAATAWAHEERRKIPLVGSERSVAANLLGLSVASENPLTSLNSAVTLYCQVKDEHCLGVYIVGAQKGARSLNDDQARAAAATGFLSQALGHPVVLPKPPPPVGGKSPTLSRWKDGNVPIVARWRDASLMELRIGEVKP